MVVQWLWLALRYGSLTLPSAADPSIYVGGLAGESKREYFDQVDPALHQWLATTASIVAGPAAPAAARTAMDLAGLCFPLIAKPDIGWCGFGVRLLADGAALDAYIAAYPAGETFLLQEHLDVRGEAGLFYVRHTDQREGRLVSLTVRHPPSVVGDGVSTVRALVSRDERLRSRAVFYEGLERVPQAGEATALSSVWSHRMGGRYEDRSDAITPQLAAVIDAIATGMPNLHVARFDVRFENLSALAAGREFKIIEINGAGSEAIEFFDPAVPFFAAYRGVLAKQATVFAIGAANRRNGFAPCGWRALLTAFWRQRRLIPLYPPSN
ncbi:hypothetical protein BH10PSE6_BH10PSE6_19630 [soil metagenome]